MLSNPEIQDIIKRAKIVHDQQAISLALDKLAEELTLSVGEKKPILLIVLNGAIIPAGHLISRLEFPLELDSVHATRYQSALEGKSLEWRAEPKLDLQDRCVIIFDDILDKGITIKSIKDFCEQKGAAEVITAVMVDKQCVRAEDGLQYPDHFGLQVGDQYIFGFGLDYKESCRNLPIIYEAAPEDQ